MFPIYPKIQLLMDQGRFPEAEAAIREQMRESIDNAHLFVLLSTALDRQNRPKEAEQAAREAIALEPEYDMAHFALCQALTSRNRHREAIVTIEEAIRLDPEDADYHGTRGRLLASLGENEKGLEATESGLAIDPDNEICRYYRSLILGQLGRHDDAAEESLGLLSDSPEDSHNHSGRGWVLAEVNDVEGAQRHFTEALRLDPTNDDARQGLAHCLKLSNPVIGWFLRFLLLLGRIPIGLLVAGVVILLGISHRLDDLEPPYSAIGNGIRMVFFTVFLAVLVVDPLFNLALRLSRDGKHALSTDERRAIRWFIVPMALGFLFLVFWILKGGKYLPIHAMAWLAVARMIYEVFESRNQWVRRWMKAAALLILAVAVWIEIATYGILLPHSIEILRTVKAAEDAPLGEELQAQLLALIRMRQNLVDYPGLAIYFLAVFGDDLRGWLRRHAPDAEV